MRGVKLKILRQLAIILTISIVSEAMSKLLNLPVPGNVIGMLMLLALLTSGLLKLEMIEDISQFLLTHLAFFFIPAGVSLINSLDILKGQLTALILVVLISTVIVMAVTGITVQLFKRGGAQ